MKPTQKDIDDTKGANAGTDVYVIREDKTETECLFKVPPSGEWKRFRDLLSNTESKTMASKVLVYACRLWPAKEEFDALVERYPGIVETFTGELIKLAGVSEAVTTKKL